MWSELSRVWGEVDALRETPWANVQPKKIRTVLDDVTNRLKELPNRMRQYGAFEHVQKAIKGYLKGNIILIDLKTEAMKERHWKALKTKLNTRWVLSDLTLGQIWESDLVKNDAVYREIITQAQGEAALEGYLKQIREYWQSFQLDLVNYQNKCRLIRGWDDLFAKLTEHSNSISSMKLSPYYKVWHAHSPCKQMRTVAHRVNLFDTRTRCTH